MTIDLRLPDLAGGSEAEQLQKIRSYLYQLTQQLQFALNAAEVQPSQREAADASQGKSLPASPAATFSSLKSLIIKSADIVNAYYEEINRRLEGSYVAQSEYGAFSQQTSQQIRENAEGILRSFENLQAISGDLAAVQESLLEINAYIRTGLLCCGEDARPTYGVEIGQQETVDGVVGFRKYARLTADRLSFFDSNDIEVAYVSDRKLYITGADVQNLSAQTASIPHLIMGRYTWYAGTDGHLTLA